MPEGPRRCSRPKLAPGEVARESRGDARCGVARRHCGMQSIDLAVEAERLEGNNCQCAFYTIGFVGSLPRKSTHACCFSKLEKLYRWHLWGQKEARDTRKPQVRRRHPIHRRFDFPSPFGLSKRSSDVQP